MQNEKKYKKILFYCGIMGSIIVLAVILFCIIGEKGTPTSLRLSKELGGIENWNVNGIQNPELPIAIKMKKGEAQIMKAVLPDVIPADYAISCYSLYTAVQVKVGGEMIYSYAEEPSTPVGRITGNIRIIVPISEDMAGEEIEIIYTPYYTQHGDISAPIFDNIGDIKLSIIYNSLFKLIVISILLCIFFWAEWITITELIGKSRINAAMSGYFSAFVFLLMMWIACSSDLPQIFGNKNGCAAYISYTCISLFAFFYSGFCGQLLKDGEKHFAVLQMISGIVPIVNSLAFAFNLYDPPQSLWASHACILLAAIISLHFSVKDCKKGMHGKIILVATGLLILFVSVGFYFYFTAPSRGYDGTIMSVGILIYISLLFSLIIEKQVSTIGERKYMDLYKELAYSDILTSMGNRTAFDREFARFFENGESGIEVSLVIFDVNFLKVTNDTLGHQKGDELIVTMGHMIQECFGRHGNCFRLGGDEFATVCFNQGDRMLELLDDFAKCISDHNEKGGLELSCSWGLSTMIWNGEKDFKQTIFAKADKEMYLDKQIKHQGRNRGE